MQVICDFNITKQSPQKDAVFSKQTTTSWLQDGHSNFTTECNSL